VRSALFACGFVSLAVVALPGAARQAKKPAATATGRSSEVRFGEFALAPFGDYIAVVGRDSAGRRIWLRRLDSFTAQPLAGTEGASYPFWSPDGRALAFFAGGKLKRINRSGDGLRILADAPNPRGGAWGGAGRSIIVFAPTPNGPLSSIPGNGGFVGPLTTLTASDVSHRWPRFLPDGRHFVYLADSPRADDRVLMLGSLGEEASIPLEQADSSAEFVYLRSVGARHSQLLFVRKGKVHAVPFDTNPMQPAGAAVPVELSVRVDEQKYLFLSAAEDVMAYAGGVATQWPRVDIVSRRGVRVRRIESGDDLGVTYVDARISPNRRYIALTSLSDNPSRGSRSIWVYDLVHNTRERLTTRETNALGPVWSPDGARLAFASNRGNKATLIVTTLAGRREETVWTIEGGELMPMDWSHEGHFLMAMHVSDAGSEIAVLPLAGNRTPRTLISSSSLSIGNARFSPDGRWVLYGSAESGRPELYVMATSDQNKKWPVSHDGAMRAVWRPDGRALFYVNADEQLVAVPVHEMASRLRFGAGRPLFHAALAGIGDSLIDITKDGRQFVLVEAGQSAQYRLLTTDVATEARRLGWATASP